jgi:hypothetical protein
MFSKQSEIKNSKADLCNYILDKDVYNSILLSKLSDSSIYREEYEITTNQYRPDLIARDFNGSTDYTGLVLLQAKRGLDTFTKGSIIKLIPIQRLNLILENI